MRQAVLVAQHGQAPLKVLVDQEVLWGLCRLQMMVVQALQLILGGLEVLEGQELHSLVLHMFGNQFLQLDKETVVVHLFLVRQAVLVLRHVQAGQLVLEGLEDREVRRRIHNRHHHHLLQHMIVRVVCVHWQQLVF